MGAILGVAAVFGFVVAWNWYWYKASGGRVWSPLWLAFSSTATAVVFVVSGLAGYTLSRHDRFVSHTAWTGGVIWWEVGVGLGAAALAVLFWRRGLRLPPGQVAASR